MKRILTTLAFIAISIVAFAQNDLKGTWKMTESMMGLTCVDVLEFNDNKSGVVSDNGKLDINMSMMGVNITGTIEARIKGDFTFDGEKIVIKWSDDVETKVTKPLTATHKGEVVPDGAVSFKDFMDDFEKEMKAMAGTEDVYFGVQIKGDKLTVKSKDENGKTVTEKYTRIK